jgi:hypothetical protein
MLLLPLMLVTPAQAATLEEITAFVTDVAEALPDHFDNDQPAPSVEMEKAQ